MPSRRIGRRIVAWATALAALAAVATVALAGPAVADGPTPPPWVNGQLQPGDGIGYRLSSTSPPVFKRNPDTLWGPVTLSRQTSPNFSFSLLASEPGPSPGSHGWPSTWSSNGVTLQRADQFCDIVAASSCQYYVASGAGQSFWFGAAIPPSGGGPAFDLSGFNQGALQLPPPPALTAVFNPPAGGTLPASGSFTFDGSGSHDGLPGALNYRWTLLSANGQTLTQDGPQSTYTPPSSVFSQNGQYCVTLVVTASDGATAHQGPSCFGVTISNPTPTPPPAVKPNPPAPPAGGSQPTPAANNTPASPVNFAKPIPNFAVPVPGAVQQVTVIWLWKPDWFQATASGVGKAAKTSGRPKAVARASVNIDQNAHHASQSGVPWLAGLGVFGIFGAGWLAFRRQRVRASLLD